MKLNVYSVYDVKAACYGTPFFMSRDEMAIRAFGDLSNDQQSKVFAHPEDYSLFKLGEYNDVTAEIISDKPKCLGVALNMRKSQVVDISSMKLGSLNNKNEKVEVK